MQRLVKHRYVKKFKILIIEQADDGRKFNRGALLNAGFHYLQRTGMDYHQVILHDADLLPASECMENWYAADIPEKHMFHLTAEGYPKHNGRNKIAGASRGVVSLRCDDFKDSNGFPLDVWGWSDCIDDRIFSERCGQMKLRYYACPVGAWTDLDTVNLRSCPEASAKADKYYDDLFLKSTAPSLSVPKGRNGQVAAGPAVLHELSDVERLRINANRKGGLDTLDYKAIFEDVFLIHSLRVRVQLAPYG
jgi:hypothetical protein